MVHGLVDLAGRCFILHDSGGYDPGPRGHVQPGILPNCLAALLGMSPKRSIPRQMTMKLTRSSCSDLLGLRDCVSSMLLLDLSRHG